MHNQACLIRNLTNDPNCKYCGETETLNHLFRNCNRVKDIWKLLNHQLHHDPGDINFFIWLDNNLQSKISSNYPNWNILFAITLWYIWKSRNNFQFNDKNTTASAVVNQCLNYFNFCKEAFQLCEVHSKQKVKDKILTKWVCPNAGCIKINTDGSCDNEENRGGFGGLARSTNGKWIEGFVGYLGCADPLTAELRGILQGLKLCKERNWTNVFIETDCKNAVDLIHQAEISENHPQGSIIDECKEIKRDMLATIGHTPREANRCADALAKIGANQKDALVRLLVPPNEVIEEMACDMRPTAYGRNV